jgi:AcrR family transcriptional regulator
MDTKTRILTKALELFLINGYENTSMRHLAKTLQLTKPAIYHYFPGKNELALQVVDYFEARMLEWSKEFFAGTADFSDFIRRFCSMAPFFSRVENMLLDNVDPGQFRMGFDDLLAAMSRDNPKLRTRMAEIFARTRSRIAGMASEAIARGKLRNDISPDTLALMVHALTEGLGFLGRYDPEGKISTRGEEVAALLNNLINNEYKGENQ